MSKKRINHGLKGTPEYSTWVNMRQRCNNPRGHDVHYYKGITICDEWDDPCTFVRDMGPRPSLNHQIDRKDNTKGYSKDNCHWVERAPQMRNTRLAKWWYVEGVRFESLTVAASVLGVGAVTVRSWCDGKVSGKYKYPPKPGCWSEKKYAL